MQGYPYGTELEQAPPMPGYNQLSFEKFTHNGEQIHNNLDEQDTLDEEQPEPLPVPQMQTGGKRVEFKKSGPQYRKFQQFTSFTNESFQIIFLNLIVFFLFLNSLNRHDYLPF